MDADFPRILTAETFVDAHPPRIQTWRMRNIRGPNIFGPQKKTKNFLDKEHHGMELYDKVYRAAQDRILWRQLAHVTAKRLCGGVVE